MELISSWCRMDFDLVVAKKYHSSRQLLEQKLVFFQALKQ